MEQRVKALENIAIEHKRTEDALKNAHDELELRVKERTKELKAKLFEMKRNENEILKHKTSMEKINLQLLETNQALSVLARNIDKDKEAIENRIFKIVNSKITPIVMELKEDKRFRKREADLEALEAHLNILVSDLSLDSEIDTSLTDQEMNVAVMIKNGLTSQKIAKILCVSLNTIKTHRKNIRKKLKIQNSKLNLTSYLNRNYIDNG